VTTAHFTGTNGTPDSTTSYYMGGQYELKDGAAKKYYSIAGMMVAVKDSTGAIQYLLTDHPSTGSGRRRKRPTRQAGLHVRTPTARPTRTP